MEAQIGAFTCSRLPAGGDGAGFTSLIGSKTGALSTSHEASSSSSAHPGEHTPADRDGVRSAHPAMDTPDLPSQNCRRNGFPGDKGQTLAAIRRSPGAPVCVPGIPLECNGQSKGRPFLSAYMKQVLFRATCNHSLMLSFPLPSVLFH